MIRNRKDRDKRVKGKFSSIIIRNYVFFSILLVVLLFFVLVFIVSNMDKLNTNSKIGELAKQYSKLSSSEYNTIDEKNYIGDDGFVQIVDSDYDVIYQSSGSKKYIDYSKTVITLIPEYDDEIMYDSEKIRNDKNQVIYYRDIYDNNYMYNINSYIDILNGSTHRILFSNQFPTKKSFTAVEFSLLKSGKVNGYTVNKASFTGNDGSKYKLITFTKKGLKNSLGKKERAFVAIGTGFAGIYVLLLILFSIWSSRSVKKTLKILESAMKEVSSGKTGKQIDYEGPKEFVDICDNFNAMSNALYESARENQRLQDENQRIVSDISHDLKTPITVIQGYSKAISDGIVPVEEQDKYLKIIAQKSEELIELINEIHDYTKLSHSDYKFDMKPLDICEYTREFFARSFDELEIAGFLLEVDIPEVSVIVNLDIGKFSRVYANLVNNFIKYNKPGSKLRCTLTYDDRSVTINISDNGTGIAKNIKKTIFEPFVMGEKSRGSGGSGLGLPMVRKIVEYHGGTVELLEKPEKGMKTTFSIRLLRL